LLTSNIFWTASIYHVLNNCHHRLTGIKTYFNTDFIYSIIRLSADRIQNTAKIPSYVDEVNVREYRREPTKNENPEKLATLGKQDGEK